MDKLKDFNPDKIKFTYMNADDFEISLDRLTRFKFTEKKYFRVFSEIITKHLTTPKLSRQDIESLKTETMVRIVENIWNGSLKNHIKQLGTEKFLNELLKKEPDLLQRLPLGSIATYLGITQASLSRIRAKLK